MTMAYLVSFAPVQIDLKIITYSLPKMLSYQPFINSISSILSSRINKKYLLSECKGKTDHFQLHLLHILFSLTLTYCPN
jgi:hypothetical protein